MTVSQACETCGEPVSRYPSGVIVHRATAMKSCSAPQSGDVPRKGQVVRYRHFRTKRYEYMRLVESAEVRQMASGPYLRLWGYKCRATGLPINIQPSASFLPAAEIEIIARGSQ